MTLRFPKHLIIPAALVGCVHGQTVVTPKVESIAMFKNAVAMVRTTFPINGAGDYVWEEIPPALHGSFHIRSNARVEVTSKSRKIREAQPPTPGLGENLQRELAGQSVVVTLKGNGAQPTSRIQGTVWNEPEQPTENTRWGQPSTAPGVDPNARFSLNLPPRNPTSSPLTNQFLILEDQARRRTMIALQDISSVNSLEAPAAIEQSVERKVLEFRVSNVPEGAGVVEVSFLAPGITWIPSYRLEITDANKATLSLSAVVKNELCDFENAELELISGFPNMQFGSVASPLLPTLTLQSFFQQLGAVGSFQPGGVLSNTISQQISYQPMGAPSALPSVEEIGAATNDDLHYQSIGIRSMGIGDAIDLEIDHKVTDYERIVEWIIADRRDEYGISYQTPGAEIPVAWDALQFRNPFPFPMTTAPTVIVDDDRFRGQTTSNWTNPGAINCLRITQALSFECRAAEVEEESARELVRIGGRDYRRTIVRGNLSVRNARGTAATMVIRTELSGELISADGEPELGLRTAGIASVNPRRQIDWKLALQAGETKEMEYRYSVLVRD